jgi:aryl-alcohol dehydrogenase-like predicted oxidoreductase
MRYQELGGTEQRVSRICLGTWQLGGAWGPDVEEGIAAVSTAFDLGVNFFDTAAAYGGGTAERALAKGLGALLHQHREELVISTKGGLEVHTTESGAEVSRRNSDPAFLRSGLEQSLKNLQIECVDVYFVHWPDPTIPLAETAGLVGEFIAEGLVRFAGVSNFSVAQMEEFAAERPVDVAQLPYNLVDQSSKQEAIPYCAEHGIGVMGWSALAHGILSGTLHRGQVFPAGDWRAGHPAFSGAGFAAVIDGLEELTEIARSLGCSLPQLALAWVLADPDAVVPVVGAQTSDHIADSAAAVDVELSSADVERIAQAAKLIPGFSLETEAQD